MPDSSITVDKIVDNAGRGEPPPMIIEGNELTDDDEVAKLRRIVEVADEVWG